MHRLTRLAAFAIFAAACNGAERIDPTQPPIETRPPATHAPAQVQPASARGRTRCDQTRLAAAAEALRLAREATPAFVGDASASPGFAAFAREILEACRDLPPSIAWRLRGGLLVGPPPAEGLGDLRPRYCPDAPPLAETVALQPAHVRARHDYDACRLEALGFVSRHDFAIVGDPLPPAVFTVLRDAGIDLAVARSVARGLVFVTPDIDLEHRALPKLPTTRGMSLPMRGLVLELWPGGASIPGAGAPQPAWRSLVGALLHARATMGASLAEPDEAPDEPNVVLLAHPSVPASTAVELAEELARTDGIAVALVTRTTDDAYLILPLRGLGDERPIATLSLGHGVARAHTRGASRSLALGTDEQGRGPVRDWVATLPATPGSTDRPIVIRVGRGPEATVQDLADAIHAAHPAACFEMLGDLRCDVRVALGD